MKMHINVIKGDIVITFGAPVTWVSFSPTEARQLAENLKMAADAADLENAPKGKPS